MKFYEFLDRIDQLEGYELWQFFVAIIIAGLGLMLTISAVLNTIEWIALDRF